LLWRIIVVVEIVVVVVKMMELLIAVSGGRGQVLDLVGR